MPIKMRIDIDMFYLSHFEMTVLALAVTHLS